MAKIVNALIEGSAKEACRVLKEGGVIVYPTETLYGIGALATNTEAARRVFDIKGRQSSKPIPILVKDLGMMEEYAEVGGAARRLIAEFMPGPLTLVLRDNGRLPKEITAGAGKVAVRISGSEFVKNLFSDLDEPITSTSANLSGAPNIFTIKELIEVFSDKVDLIIDSGNLSPSRGFTLGSTLLDMTQSPPELLREGDVKAHSLKLALKRISK